jgi:hypothetical protein
MEYKETYVLNFFFGRLLEQPIKFNYKFPNLKDSKGEEAEVFFELFNNEYLFSVEEEFLEFNSIASKQEIGHNFQACAHTGVLKIVYPSFNSDDSYAYTERVNSFLQYFVAYLLTFFQRRRVIFGCPKLTSGDRLILAMPPFLAGEFVDSMSYGEPAVLYSHTEKCLVTAITTYVSFNDFEKGHIRMLLTRYNETLNLPYAYERVESYLRILEALGDVQNLSQAANQEYERVKAVIGMRKNSVTLKKIVQTLVDYKLVYSDEEIKDSFDFRNKTMHEYLNPNTIKEPYLANIFRFLNICIEQIVLSVLKIDKCYYVEPSYMLIENRVL